MASRFREDLDAGAVRLLDGGIGTELQRRGATMAAQAWCGAATLEDTAILEQVHKDFIAAGADVITTNTYSSGRWLLELDGLGHRFEEVNGTAVDCARAAIARSGRSNVLVAGSLSHRGPMVAGSARPDVIDQAALDAMAESVRELAVFLREAGCDVLLLEMLYDPRRITPVLDAASRAGLPIWAGFSARRGPQGRVLGFDTAQDIPFEDVVSVLSDYDVELAGVMHTPSDVVSDALEIVRAVFDGPLLAYPDSGYFKSPHWEFEDVIGPSDLRRFAEEWVAQGAGLIGGCCGLSPEHIAALRPLRRDRAAS